MSARTRLLFSLCYLALCARTPLARGDLQKPETLPQSEPVIAHEFQLGTDGTDEHLLSYKEPQKRTLSCAHLAQNFLRAHGDHPSPESNPKLDALLPAYTTHGRPHLPLLLPEAGMHLLGSVMYTPLVSK